MFPISLFIQPRSLPLQNNGEQVIKWFEKILSDHRREGSPNIIYNLALSEVAYFDEGTRTIQLAVESLDVIKKYLPYFNNVFVGTIALPHTDPYCSGIMDSNFRWNNIYASRTASELYINYMQRNHISIPLHWYIPYEANLNYFGKGCQKYSGWDIKEVYLAYILQVIEDLTQINRNHGLNDPAFLWSPAFWTKYQNMSGNERRNLVINLRNLLDRSPKLSWLHFQDYIGQSSRRNPNGIINYYFTADDAINYFKNVLVPANSSKHLISGTINMEFFISDSKGNLYPGDPIEHAERLCAYRKAGIGIGFSWEIRWWYWSLYGQ